MVTKASDWKKSGGTVGGTYELKVPSGHTCLVKRPGPEMFAQQGLMPNSLLEIVMPLIERAQEEGKTGDSTPMPDASMAELQKQILNDPVKIADMITSVDNITVFCVLQPKVWPVSKRDEVLADPDIAEDVKEATLAEYLFVDEVDFADKMFIFQYAVGGSANLERFREGTEALVDAGQAGD